MIHPIWSIYKQTCGLDVKEPFDTFDWLTGQTRNDYNSMRDAVNKAGGREWLMSYDGAENLHNIPIACRILSMAGTHHSGSSVTSLLQNYKAALEDWDATVARWKTLQAKEEYDKKQISRDEVYNYYNSWRPGNILATICEKSGLTEDVVRPMLDARKKELEDEFKVSAAHAEKRRFDDQIDLLEHHYKFPHRWHDNEYGSSLFGSLNSITPAMMAVMEARYPGYKKHIADIRKN